MQLSTVHFEDDGLDDGFKTKPPRNTHKYYMYGGKRGIRTLGTGKPVRRISNPVHSTTLPSFRVLLKIQKEF